MEEEEEEEEEKVGIEMETDTETGVCAGRVVCVVKGVGTEPEIDTGKEAGIEKVINIGKGVGIETRDWHKHGSIILMCQTVSLLYILNPRNGYWCLNYP